MRNILIISKTASLVFAVLALFSYAALAQSNYVTVRQRNGEVKIPKGVKKVVVFDLGVLETCQELGIPVAGVPNSVPDYLSEYKADKYAKLGGITKPDIKALEKFKPDLIITTGRQGSYYDSLATIAPTVSFSTDAANFWESFEQNVRTIASLYGKENMAEAKLTALSKKIELVKAKAKNDSGRSLMVLHVNKRFAPNGPNSRFGFGYDVLGLKSAYIPVPNETSRNTSATKETPAPQRTERPATPSLDQINPDYLFIIDRETGIKGGMPDLNELMNDEIRKTNAFKNNKVFLLPGSVWYLSGNGLISVDKKITDIGRQLYGLEL